MRLWVICGGDIYIYVVCEGLCNSCCMACRLVLESANMPSHGSYLWMYEATWMADSSALIIVCVFFLAGCTYVSGGVCGGVDN